MEVSAESLWRSQSWLRETEAGLLDVVRDHHRGQCPHVERRKLKSESNGDAWIGTAHAAICFSQRPMLE